MEFYYQFQVCRENMALEVYQKYWQILPIGPTSYGDSPYQSFSTYAGNPYFISLEDLIDQGLLTEDECKKVKFGNRADTVDYEKLYNGRFKLLKKAYKKSNIGEKEEFKKFKDENCYWLNDYAMFMLSLIHISEPTRP